MPILNIEIIGPLEESLLPGLAERLANLAGQALNSRPQGTWVKLKFVPRDQYAENQGGPPPGVLPVIVTLLQATVPHGNALARQAGDLASAIAEGLERPREHIHIIVEPAAKTRIFFGGEPS